MRLERITAQAFRGYPERVDLILAGDVALIYGDNGAGKTSLTEAFEWALYGTVVRKSRSKTAGEYKGWSWLRSAHARSDIETFAEVELVTSGGQRHVVRRTLNGRDGGLTIDGKPESDIRPLGLRTEDAFRPFLGQCEIQAVIDSEQQDRWQQLSAILGLGRFGSVRARLQRLRTDTDAHSEVHGIRDLARRAVQPVTPAGEDPLSVDPDALRRRMAKYLGLGQEATWTELLEASDVQLRELFSRDKRPPGIAALIVGTEELASASTELVNSLRGVEREAREHGLWHRQYQHVAFIGEGLSQAAGLPQRVCPFCGQETLTDERMVELQAVASSAPPMPSDHRDDVGSALSQLRGPGPLNDDVVPSLLASLEGELKDALLELQQEQADLVNDRRRLEGLVRGWQAAIERMRRSEEDDSALSSLTDQAVEVVNTIRRRHALIRASTEALQLRFTETLTGLDETEKRRLEGLQKVRLLAENRTAIRSAWRVRQLQADIADFVTLLEAEEKRRMALALKTLSHDIASYYEELSPGHHIKITGVTVRDTRFRQAALEAQSFGRTVNPVTTFSEAEGNCLGLSVYFSQRVDRNPQWEMILLDDPVQSMDAGHEQGLVQLLARVSRGRQVVAMTHDARFAESFEAQFAAVPSFIRYNIQLSGEPQPRIELAAGRLNELLAFAEANSDGDRAIREASAAAIRKAVERFTRDLAGSAAVALPKKLSIEDVVNRVHQHKLVDDIDVGTLHRLRRFGTRSAHEDPLANATGGAIRASVRALRELQDKYLATPKSGHLKLVVGGRSETIETTDGR